MSGEFGFQRFGEGNERRLALTANAEVGPVFQQVIGVQRRVEAVQADFGGRIDLTDALGNTDTEAQRGMHRDGDADELRSGDLFRLEALDRDVQRVRRETGPLQKRLRQCGTERLMAQLVAGDQQNRAG